MKKIIIAILFLVPFTCFSQTYYLKVDSVNLIKLKSGKNYTIKVDGIIRVEQFKGFKGDTFLFENESFYYKRVEAIKNPKRHAVIEAIAYPLSIGSCIALSTIPISYVKGYFLADTDKMFNTLLIFIGESMAFSASRSYLVNNKKWIPIDELEKLVWGEKA